MTRYHVQLPHAGLAEIAPGHFRATEHAEQRMGFRGLYLGLRDRTLGSALANWQLESERLSKIKALAVFSSDALSSTAYATQEILFVLVLAGAGAIDLSLPIGIAITTLLAVVVISYRQTVRAYPNGGGAYIVAHENLGTTPGLVAASALLIDYVLTVSVSIAAAMDALASLHSGFRPFAVEIAVLVVAFVTIINLRGLRESGTIFAIPTYAFVATLGAAIAVGLGKVILDGGNPLAAGEPREPIRAVEGLGLLLVLRAFANGCAALTGVEAISNGVQAFKRPSDKNAATTLTMMGLILGSLFLGVTILARHHGFVPHEDDTIPAQLGVESFGDGTVLFGLLQVMTAGILMLAANTAFADFPRLSAILARDGYMPRLFHSRGNRLVFSSGIITLAVLAAILLVAFDARTTRLIPLYALGVFLSFTLSQSGMVMHWWRSRDPGWTRSLTINGLGALVTGLVLLIILQAKFAEGAWIIVVLIPVIAIAMSLVGRFYRGLKRGLNVAPEAVIDVRPVGLSPVPIIVPVEEINLATVMAIGAACERSSSVTAVHVTNDPDDPSDLERRWYTQFPGIPLVVIDSPYRTVADPIAVYVTERLRAEGPHQVAIAIPVVEPRHRYQGVFVNQGLKRLKTLFEGNRRVTVTEYPFSVGSRRSRRTPARPA